MFCNVKVKVSPLKLTSSLLPSSKQNVIVFRTDFFNQLSQARKILYNHSVCLKQN